jgi:formylglycine-generating enzyme required for sulfatase activity
MNFTSRWIGCSVLHRTINRSSCRATSRNSNIERNSRGRSGYRRAIYPIGVRIRRSTWTLLLRQTSHRCISCETIARVFGFAPPGGTDDDEVWREWWATLWPSFTPSEINLKEKAPASEFQARYLDELGKGTLIFQKPVLPRPVTRPQPTFEQIREISGLIEKFRTELASEPRYGNVQHFLLGLLDRIRDLPEPSQWSEVHLDRLLNVQLALNNTFHRGDSDTGVDAISFGVLAPLLSKLLEFLDGRNLSNDYSVIVDNQLAPHVDRIRETIRNLPLVEMPPAPRDEIVVLGDYLEVVEQSADKRINLKRVDDMAGRIRRHRLGALHSIEQFIAVLIGKRVDRAPELAIFRDELDGGGLGPELVIVPAGSFLMGSPDREGHLWEQPQRAVTIAYRFAVGVCPVTRGEFAAFVEATGHKAEDDGGRSWRDPGFRQDDDHSAVCVNWHDAQAYVAWLKARSDGKSYRLLSEAEWEYCCRAGTLSAYSTGESITSAQANFGRDANGTTSVFKFPPNPWRLRDMHGNVWEWCEDNWHDDYNGDPPSDGSVWLGGDASLRVLRGGSWVNLPEDFRSAERMSVHSVNRGDLVGVRVARTL